MRRKTSCNKLTKNKLEKVSWPKGTLFGTKGSISFDLITTDIPRKEKIKSVMKFNYNKLVN